MNEDKTLANGIIFIFSRPNNKYFGNLHKLNARSLSRYFSNKGKRDFWSY